MNKKSFEIEDEIEETKDKNKQELLALEAEAYALHDESMDKITKIVLNETKKNISNSKPVFYVAAILEAFESLQKKACTCPSKKCIDRVDKAIKESSEESDGK